MANFCEQCGVQITGDTKFCERCGAPVDDEEPPQSPQSPISQEPAEPISLNRPPSPTAPPKSIPVPHIYIALGIVVVVIIIAAVFASGVLSGVTGPKATPGIPVTPTKELQTISSSTTETTIASSQDFIIGTWRNIDSNGNDTRYQFSKSGIYAESINGVETSSGTWIVQGGNSYRLYETDGPQIMMQYNLAKNIIYERALSPSINKEYSRYP